MDKTKIDWAEATWNPVTGCFHDCPYCYAKAIANRFKGGNLTVDGKEYMPEVDYNFDVHGEKKLVELDAPVYKKENDKLKIAQYPYGFNPTLHRYKLDENKDKSRPRNIFVGSMCDLFGEWVPDGWLKEIFEVCEAAPHHNYLFLTKNPKRYIELAEKEILPNENNFWYGSTVTTAKDMFLWACDNKFHTFLSIEPILSDFGDFNGTLFPEWVIIGAETGQRKSKVIPRKKWIDNLIYECKKRNVPVFLKESLRGLYGDELIQEFPKGLAKRN